ncbi:Rio2, N-terminal-domain-containing protein [Pelagophyceae sp. CCMP2097]|nr:Rio2, N-terminal-domain-containing protein [Pelagophyceae sp. CCMP2097]
MGKLDVGIMRHMSKDEFRVLTAVEMGMRNHNAVPVPLIVSIAGLRHGGSQKLLQNLLRWKLVYHDHTHYDGYRLTWSGYDFLALNVLQRRGIVDRVGRKIGEGKESDVYEAFRDSDGMRLVIKLHRLGKTSFKAVKSKRDYLQAGTKSAGNWLNLSRLAAKREWDFMQLIHTDMADEVVVPLPLDWNRHAIVMSLVHCDLNEFNLIVDANDATVTLIDFPQLVSAKHANALDYYQRDVKGIAKFFKHKLKFEPEEGVDLDLPEIDNDKERLDGKVKASGYDYDGEASSEAMSPKDQDELDAYYSVKNRGDGDEEGGSGDESDEDESDEDEDEAEEAAPLREHLFDDEALTECGDDRSTATSTATSAQMTAQKLRREQAKKTAGFARHNGSRNFSKSRAKGKIRHDLKFEM